MKMCETGQKEGPDAMYILFALTLRVRSPKTIADSFINVQA